MGLFSNPKIEGDELQQCLAYFEAETKVITFQTKEADIYNNAMVKYGNSIIKNTLAAKEACKAVKRLTQSAAEVCKRHEEIKDIPTAAQAMRYAWHLTFLANLAWASATAAAIEAMANDMDPNVLYVQQLVEEYQKAWRIADDEDKKFINRLKVSGEDIAQIMYRATKASEMDDWEPTA
jgi:hypothetical protein